MKHAVVAGLVIIVAAAAAYIVQSSYSVSLDNQPPQLDGNDGFVDFTLPDLHGSERQLSDWNGTFLRIRSDLEYLATNKSTY